MTFASAVIVSEPIDEDNAMPLTETQISCIR